MSTPLPCPNLFHILPTPLQTEQVAGLDEVTDAWMQAMALRDDETMRHTLRVTELTASLSQRIQPNSSNLENLRRGAMLHDIGKLAVPDRILLKPGPLDDADWQIMRQHPTLAYQILKPLPYPAEVLDIPYCHHERWNGSGYPRGLKQTQIPLPARIFAVVDVWDALCSRRPYRAAWSSQQAIQHICEQAGQQFDPGVVVKFFELLQEEPQSFLVQQD